MIVVRADLCTGCGVCLEVCPTGALYLVEGRATLDRALCRECKVCLEACPTGAITFVARDEPVAEEIRVPALRPESNVVQVRTERTPSLFRSKVLPVVGSALVWAERDFLPWLADFLDKKEPGQPQVSDRREVNSRQGLNAEVRDGRQQRRRRRGGG